MHFKYWQITGNFDITEHSIYIDGCKLDFRIHNVSLLDLSISATTQELYMSEVTGLYINLDWGPIGLK